VLTSSGPQLSYPGYNRVNNWLRWHSTPSLFTHTFNDALHIH